jgi:hypothetical protein
MVLLLYVPVVLNAAASASNAALRRLHTRYTGTPRRTIINPGQVYWGL